MNRPPLRLISTLLVLPLLISATTAPSTNPDTLFARPSSYTTSFDAGILHVDVFGSGSRPLILIPGLACGSWVWYGTIEKFSPDYKIYAITLPGFDTHPPTDKRPLFATAIADFWKILDDHEIHKPILIGHSLGGTLTIALAEQHPERLSAIVCVDGLPVFPMFADVTPDQRKVLAAGMISGAATLTPSGVLANARQFMSSIGTNRPELVEPVAQLEARSDAKSTADWMQEDLSQDFRPDLKKITTPMLELMPYNPFDNQGQIGYTEAQTRTFYESLIAGAPAAKVLAISPSRHFVMLDQPEQFYKAVGDFISTTPAP